MDIIRLIHRDQMLRSLVILFVAGFAPIGALSLTIFGLWSLPVGAVCLTVPLAIVALCVARLNPNAGRLAGEGFVAGLVAVLIYDCSRWSLSAYLGLHDFIPNIGGWLLGTGEPNWIAGYAWRYLGNGAGMGVGFVALVTIVTATRNIATRDLDHRALGALYGIGVWVCLLITLLLSPRGQEMMFPLTVPYYWVTLIGHVVYGGVLGSIIHARRVGVRIGATSRKAAFLPSTGFQTRSSMPAIA